MITCSGSFAGTWRTYNVTKDDTWQSKIITCPGAFAGTWRTYCVGFTLGWVWFILGCQISWKFDWSLKVLSDYLFDWSLTLGWFWFMLGWVWLFLEVHDITKVLLITECFVRLRCLGIPNNVRLYALRTGRHCWWYGAGCSALCWSFGAGCWALAIRMLVRKRELQDFWTGCSALVFRTGCSALVCHSHQIIQSIPVEVWTGQPHPCHLQIACQSVSMCCEATSLFFFVRVYQLPREWSIAIRFCCSSLDSYSWRQVVRIWSTSCGNNFRSDCSFHCRSSATHDAEATKWK